MLATPRAVDQGGYNSMAEDNTTTPSKPERADLSDLSTPERHAIAHLFTAVREALLSEINAKVAMSTLRGPGVTGLFGSASRSA